MSIRRDAIYNLAGSAIPVIVSLITIPLYLHLIGEARFGVLALLWLLLGYFGLLDLGVGVSTAQKIAAQSTEDRQVQAETAWTACALSLMIGVVLAALTWPIAIYVFSTVVNIEPTLREEILGAVPWIILAIPLATVSGALTGALQGRAYFFEVNGIAIIGTTAFQAAPIGIAMWWGPELQFLVPAALFSRLLTFGMTCVVCWRRLLRWRMPVFTASRAVELLRFGGWISVSAIVSPMMVVLDRFIIGALDGAKAVTHYTVPFQIVERGSIVARALSSSLHPRLAAASPRQEYRLAGKAVRILMVISTPLIACGVLSIAPFLDLWIASKLPAVSGTVGQILLLAWWINGVGVIACIALQARGRPDLVAKCHMAEVVPYLIALYALIEVFGILGAAIAFFVRVTIDSVLLVTLAGHHRRVGRIVTVPMLLIAAAFFLAFTVSHSSLVFYPLAAAHLSVVLVWSWRGLPRIYREQIYRLVPFAGR